MGDHATKASLQVVPWVVVALIVALNVALLVITFSGA
jgi:Mn2+/Fe2+ NRAMP family transporter